MRLGDNGMKGWDERGKWGGGGTSLRLENGEVVI